MKKGTSIKVLPIFCHSLSPLACENYFRRNQWEPEIRLRSQAISLHDVLFHSSQSKIKGLVTSFLAYYQQHDLRVNCLSLKFFLVISCSFKRQEQSCTVTRINSLTQGFNYYWVTLSEWCVSWLEVFCVTPQVVLPDWLVLAKKNQHFIFL